jgi:hypothetical protein
MSSELVTIAIEPGEQANAVNAALLLIEQRGDLCRSAKPPCKLGRKVGNEFVPVTAIWLRHYFNCCVDFRKDGYPADCPAWLPQFIFAKAGELQIRVVP